MNTSYKRISSYFRLKNNNRPVVIAEVGNNHNGSIKLAKEIIKTAKIIGIDVVKFQTETYDGLWADKWLDKKLNIGPYVGKRREFHETLYPKNLKLQAHLPTYVLELDNPLLGGVKNLGLLFCIYKAYCFHLKSDKHQTLLLELQRQYKHLPSGTLYPSVNNLK